ncbi:MAG: Dna2/Cas4 domain-containing protein [Chloroflexi bacterium]|nr:Dna2/Cas4 domain-containing protein [Chloroflexota bacterium]
MAGFFAILFLLAIITALALFLSARKQRAQTGLPYGARIVYADTGAWQKVERPLFARRYGLTGKPDYIVEERGATIPVEVKPNRVAPAPRESDILQLAAYALLIEENFGAAPEYGLLKYRDAVFQVELTNELRARLLGIIAAMCRDLSARDVARSHDDARRCRACGYRGACGQAL